MKTIWFQCRPIPSQSPLIYKLPYKYWYTEEPHKYAYTFTVQDEESAREMMASDTYKNNWRVNGYVVQFSPRSNKDAFIPYYNSKGEFMYWMLTKADDPNGISPDDIKPGDHRVIVEEKKLVVDEGLSIIDEKVFDDIEEEVKKIEEAKPKKKRGRPKKSKE